MCGLSSILMYESCKALDGPWARKLKEGFCGRLGMGLGLVMGWVFGWMLEWREGGWRGIVGGR